MEIIQLSILNVKGGKWQLTIRYGHDTTFTVLTAEAARDILLLGKWTTEEHGKLLIYKPIKQQQ